MAQTRAGFRRRRDCLETLTTIAANSLACAYLSAYVQGQTRRLSCLGMSASPPTPDVWLRRSKSTLRAMYGRVRRETGKR